MEGLSWQPTRARAHRVAGPALFLLCAVSACSLLSCGGGSGNGSSFVAATQAPSVTPTPTPTPLPLTGLAKLSSDTFTNSASQHATEVEPSAAAFGATIVTAFQIGRLFQGGGAAIGFATSLDNGVTWTNGILPNITIYQGGTYAAVSDASVAYDAAHQMWLASTLGVTNNDQVILSRSSDGLHWGNPISISASPNADKNWLACDNTSTSPFYGHCYAEWDDPSDAGRIWMATSADGGLTWSSSRTGGSATGIGGLPMVQPDGTVIVPIDDIQVSSVLAFVSHDGGASWSAPVLVAQITDHGTAGGLRASALIGAAMDGQGTAFVVWQDCRFRNGCASNDILLSSSHDGINWSAPARVPIDDLSGAIDHFIPVLAIDPSSGGNAAHLALLYYFYPVSTCTSATCGLSVGIVSSQDGGSSWTTPTTLAGPMSLSWLPSTTSGLMVGDYAGAVYSAGKVFTIFAVASAPSSTLLDEAVYAAPNAATHVTNAVVRRFDSRFERTVPNARSDHPKRQFYDLERRYQIAPHKPSVRQ
jgi:hypothetical protein